MEARRMSRAADGRGPALLICERAPGNDNRNDNRNSSGNGRGRGALFMPASAARPRHVNLMVMAGGVLSVSMFGYRANWLGIRPMTGARRRPGRANYLVSVESQSCRGTGISAAERCQTINALGNPHSDGFAVKSPGHVMPCLVFEDEHPAEPDALVHHYCSARFGSLATAWIDVLGHRGELADIDYCRELASAHGLPVLTAGDVRAFLAGCKQPGFGRVA